MKTLRLIAALAALVASAAFAQEASTPKAEPAKRAAEIAPKAVKSLLLDVTRAGDQLVAVGARGTVIVSTDGERWTQQPVPINSTLTAVAFADAKQGWAVGHDAAILHTADAGKSWQLQHFDPALEKALHELLVFDTQHVLAVGAYGLLLETRDGGVNWTEVAAPALTEEGLHFNAVLRLGNGALFVAGEAGMLGWSQDGVNWARLPSFYEGSFFGAVPKGQAGAIVFGLRGNVYSTDDVSSNSWTKVETGSVESLFGGAALDSGGTVMVGADGFAAVLDAQGTFKRLASDKSSGVLSGVVPWQKHLIAVGEAGVVKREMN